MDITLGDVRYNASAGTFEARVDIKRRDTIFRYPCEIAGPITMDMNDVRAGLRRRALAMSDSPSRLMSHV